MLNQGPSTEIVLFILHKIGSDNGLAHVTTPNDTWAIVQS